MLLGVDEGPKTHDPVMKTGMVGNVEIEQFRVFCGKENEFVRER